MSDKFLLLARALLAAMFLASGYAALADPAATAAYFAGLGLPLPAVAAWGTGIFELAAGLAILAGFMTRLAAAVLAVFCLVASFLGHYGQGGGDAMLTFMHGQMLLKDLAVAGGLVLLSLQGAGGHSVDRWRGED